MEEVDKLLCGEHSDNDTEGTGGFNFQVNKKPLEKQSIVLNGKDIQYNYYEFSYEQMTVGSLSDDETTNTKTGFIIAYSFNKKVKYIINRNSQAQRILRKLLNYSGKGEVIKDTTSFTGDFFVWLLKKVYTGDNTIESESEQIENVTVDSVRGFKGDTEDLLTKVSAMGESVMNIISTLSFLLESQNLNQITLDIAYGDHKNIGVTLSNKNTVAVDLDRYQGKIFQSINTPDGIATIFLVLYIEILPLIVQSYQEEKWNTQWGQGKCVEFLQSVAHDLSEKVTTRVEELRNEPEQLRIPPVPSVNKKS